MQTDARIEDVRHTLAADPVEYVRRILVSFGEGKFNRDEAVVRIGVSGKGIRPHYAIEEGDGDDVRMLQDGHMLRGFRNRKIFYGGSHRPILEQEFMGVSWSSTASTYSEVQSILGRLRASNRKH